MKTLVDFIHAERDFITALFETRVRAAHSGGVSESYLRDGVPQFLTDVAHALQAGDKAHSGVSSQRARDNERALRRQPPFSLKLHALIREYGILRDCIFERLEAAQISPSLAAVRVLSACLSSSVADSLARYMEEREHGSEAERQYLLGLFQQAPASCVSCADAR